MIRNSAVYCKEKEIRGREEESEEVPSGARNAPPWLSRGQPGTFAGSFTESDWRPSINSHLTGFER